MENLSQISKNYYNTITLFYIIFLCNIFRISVAERTKDLITVTTKDNKATIYASPFKIEFFKDGTLVSVVNARGLMNYEHFREKKVEPVP